MKKSFVLMMVFFFVFAMSSCSTNGSSSDAKENTAAIERKTVDDVVSIVVNCGYSSASTTVLIFTDGSKRAYRDDFYLDENVSHTPFLVKKGDEVSVEKRNNCHVKTEFINHTR